MNRITLDFSGIDSPARLHGYLQAAFCLPDYYGCNMDALWDCLSCRYDSSTTISLRNFPALREALPREAALLLELLKDLAPEDGVILEL